MRTTTAKRRAILVATMLMATTLVVIGGPAAVAADTPLPTPAISADDYVAAVELSAERASLPSIDAAVAAGALDAYAVSDVDANGTVKVMVSLMPAMARDAAPSLRASMPDGARFVRQFENIDVMVVEVDSAAALLALARTPGVSYVEGNRIAEAFLNESGPAIKLSAAHSQNIKGQGTASAVFDNGTNYNHPAFGDCSAGLGTGSCKVYGSFEIAPDDGQLEDPSSQHGTNVSGIVVGVAPKTKLYDFDVFDGGGASFVDITTALDQVISMKNQGTNFVSVNMSLGISNFWQNGNCTNVSPALDASVKKAKNKGIVVVAAAGNSGTSSKGISYPACSPNIVSVGALYDDNLGGIGWSNCVDNSTALNQPTCFSQRGDNLDLWAPGALITAAGVTQGGTSQASPHVAGAVALLYQMNPNLSFEDARQILRTHGKNQNDPVFNLNKKRLNIPNLIDAAGGGPDTEAPTVKMKKMNMAAGFLADPANQQVPVWVSWSADDNVGVTKSQLWVKVNNDPWVKLQTANVTGSAWNLTQGGEYRFRVRAMDEAGNWSDYSYSKTVKPKVWDDDSNKVDYAKAWTTKNGAKHYGGSMVISNKKNATASMTAKVYTISVLVPLNPNYGKVKVSYDGKLQDTVNLKSNNKEYAVVISAKAWGKKKNHSIEIKVVANKGKNGAFDAFAGLT